MSNDAALRRVEAQKRKRQQRELEIPEYLGGDARMVATNAPYKV